MGIIKAAFASASTLAEDQWKEYFYCPAIPEDTADTLRDAAEAEVAAIVPTEKTVITDKTPAMIFVLRLFFFMMTHSFELISETLLCFCCDYNIASFIHQNNMQYPPDL